MRIAPTITADHVRAEAARRIEARWPIWRQLNIVRGPDADAMGAGIDAIRSQSNRLEALDPIPADYREDRHWT